MSMRRRTTAIRRSDLISENHLILLNLAPQGLSAQPGKAGPISLPQCAINQLLSLLDALISRSFGPRFRGASVRPACSLGDRIQAALPSGRPEVSERLGACQASPASHVSPRNPLKLPHRSSAGATWTNRSPSSERWSRTLDQRPFFRVLDEPRPDRIERSAAHRVGKMVRPYAGAARSRHQHPGQTSTSAARACSASGSR
jgi:hypothetical protein